MRSESVLWASIWAGSYFVYLGTLAMQLLRDNLTLWSTDPTSWAAKHRTFSHSLCIHLKLGQALNFHAFTSHSLCYTVTFFRISLISIFLLKLLVYGGAAYCFYLVVFMPVLFSCPCCLHVRAVVMCCFHVLAVFHVRVVSMSVLFSCMCCFHVRAAFHIFVLKLFHVCAVFLSLLFSYIAFFRDKRVDCAYEVNLAHSQYQTITCSYPQ